MPLNEEQQQALSAILDSDLFKRAKEEVLAEANYDVSSLLAPEAGIAMAQEKGVRRAFIILANLCRPIAQRSPVQPRSTLTRPKPQQP